MTWKIPPNWIFPYKKNIITFKQNLYYFFLLWVLYVFLTPPLLPGVRLARFHVCPLKTLSSTAFKGVTSRMSFKHIIASLLCHEGKQAIKSKAGAIKCSKEIKITALPNEWRNIPLLTYFRQYKSNSSAFWLWTNSIQFKIAYDDTNRCL